MYTRRIFRPATLLYWTRRELVLLTLLAAAPVVAYDTFEQRWLHFPWLPIALVGTAVAFILSFQNNAAYSRSWEARSIWGGIVNASRQWGMMVNDFVTDKFAQSTVDDAELAATRRRLVFRHVAWLTALRHALRQPRPWEALGRERTNREWAERIQVREHAYPLEHEIEDYSSADERSAVCGKANPAAQLLALQSRELRELRERDWIDDFRHIEMQSILNTLVEGQGKSERIKNFPYPRQYATLNATFLWIFIVLIPLGLVHEFAGVGRSIAPEFPRLGPLFVWLSVPFSVIVMWVFHTMERIGRVTENPFEGSVNDVPITTMARAIEIDLRQMLGEAPEDIPGPIQAYHDTQS